MGSYLYEWRRRGDSDWTPVARFRNWSPDPVPGNNVTFIGGSLIYLHHGFVFAVSTNTGESWSVFGEHAGISPDNGPPWGFQNITNVVINTDGIGEIRTKSRSWQDTTNLILQTRDFGFTWEIEAD